MKKYVKDGKMRFPYKRLNEIDPEEQDIYKNAIVAHVEAIKRKNQVKIHNNKKPVNNCKTK